MRRCVFLAASSLSTNRPPTPPYLQVGHLGVALLRASVVGQLDVPEARQLVDQHRVLLDEGVEDVLQWGDNS